MADLGDKGSESSSENQIKRSKNKNQDAAVSSSSSDNQFKRTCVDCGTTKTPLWRGGPGGPKSLCNACGIRNRKRRWALLGVKKTVKTKPNSSSNNKFSDSLKTKPSCNSDNNNTIIGTTDTEFHDSLKRRLFKLGKEFMLQKANAEKQRMKLGEVEQAACLLMALAYGSVSV